MRQLIAVAILFAAAAGAASAQDPPTPMQEQNRPPDQGIRYAPAEDSKDYLRFAFNFYDQQDGGGNPNLDEDMTILEPVLMFSKSVSDDWGLTLKLQGDIISAASIEKRFEGTSQSGASGDKYFGVDAGAFYAWSDHTKLSGGLSFSVDYDYRSVGAYFKATHETDDRNNTFALKLSYYHDSLDLILFDGSKDGQDTRRTASAGLGYTRVIDERTIGTINYDLTLQNDFLATPFNSVVAAGTEVRELLPDSRVRHALYGRLRHLLFDELAVEPGAGAYFDDWGSRAFHAEMRLYWEAVPDFLIVRPGYRYHWQSEIDDFVPTTAPVIPEFRTQDPDLGDFSSHTFGVLFIFPNASFLDEGMRLDIGFEYTLRDDDLDFYSITFGYTWRY